MIGIGAFRFQSTSKSLQKHSFVAAGWLVALLKLSLKKSKQDILRTEEWREKLTIKWERKKREGKEK